MFLFLRISQLVTSIRRHQTPPRYRRVIHRRRCMSAATFRRRAHYGQRDVIHKTEVHNVAQRRNEDRATATGDRNTKFRADRSSGSRDMLADRQTDAQTDGLITILRNYDSDYLKR